MGSVAGIIAIRFVPLTYRAQSTLWVEVPTTRAGEGPIRSEELLQSYGWIELLTSFTVLDHAVRRVATKEPLSLRFGREEDVRLDRGDRVRLGAAAEELDEG